MDTSILPITCQPALLVVNGRDTHLFRYPTTDQQKMAAQSWITRHKSAVVSTCFAEVLPKRATGCRTFDDQTNAFMTGNIMSNTLFGSYVRPRSEVECNGFTSEHGHLQQFDLAAFKTFDLRRRLRDWIAQSPHFLTQPGIAYVLFHTSRSNGQRRRVVHGALVTDTHGKRLCTLSADEMGFQSPKGRTIMDRMTPFLTHEIVSEVKPFSMDTAQTH